MRNSSAATAIAPGVAEEEAAVVVLVDVVVTCGADAVMIGTEAEWGVVVVALVRRPVTETSVIVGSVPPAEV